MTLPSVKLGEVVDVLSGFAFKSGLFNDSDGLPVVRIRDVVRGYTDTYYSGPYTEQFVVRDGDILVGMDGNFNAAKWRGGRALLNQRVCKITAKASLLDEAYLFHYLPTVLKKIEDATSFVTVKHLSAGDLRDEQIPLPPLPEQRRIAAILDKADALRTKRREALAQLDRLAQSIFVDMFGDLAVHPQRPLQELCEVITDGTHQTPTYADKGVMFLSAKNVTSGEIDWQDIKFIPQALHTELHRRVAPRRGDILLAKNGTTGVAAIVDRDEVFDIYVSLALLRPKAQVLPVYLHAAVNSSSCKRQFSGALKGIGVPNLHLKDIRQAVVPLPDLAEQEKFAAQMQVLSTLKANARSALTSASALFASLQVRAFHGDL